MKRLTRAALVLLVVAAMPAATLWAAPPAPSYGTANVDGNSGEWNLNVDFFANLYEAWNNTGDKPVRALLYLRYDCENEVLYALALALDPSNPNYLPADADADADHFIKLTDTNTTYMDESYGDDNVPPDFHYVGYNAGTQTADGWEGSALIPPGTYDDLRVHLGTRTSGGNGTAGVEDMEIDLTIICTPTAVSINSLTARAGTGPLLFALTLGGLSILASLAVVFRRRN